MSDYRDIVIATLADDLAAMTDRALDAEANVESYRLIALQLLRILHLAISDQDAWARQVHRDRNAIIEMTRGLIKEISELQYMTPEPDPELSYR